MADTSLKFLIDADHGQFYVQDLEPYDAWMAEHATDPGLPPAGWTEEAIHVHRIGVEPHSISVGTARDDMVESQITVHASAPMTEPMAEHIVEADLDASTGQLVMSSPGILPEDGPSVTVPSGLLRVRVSYIPSEPPAVDTNGGPGDHFLYQIDLWPSDQARKIAILKQGANPWAG
ncbi:sulfotransferase-like domain-containing protein [Streptomyces spinosirectus]